MKEKIQQKLSNNSLVKRVTNSDELSIDDVPRITSDTVAEHREQVIKKARKYMFPLQQARHRIIGITVTLLVTASIVFLGYCTLALYRFHSSSTFIYKVSQVVPFPIARSGGKFVSYEDYLFQLRRYTHYYESQLKLDFESAEGKQQLEAFRKQALASVVDNAYVKTIAKEQNVTVSDEDIDRQIQLLREENRLGNSDEVFEDVLQDYWGWSVSDFRRSLRDQLLAQNLVAKLDTEAAVKANEALTKLRSGADFGEIAKLYSDDPAAKENAGTVGVVERTNRDIPVQTINTLYNLKEGEISAVINTGYSLDIVKNVKTRPDGKIEASRVVINFKDISIYLNDQKSKTPTRTYVNF